MTLVILAGEIDISVGSVFAVCAVSAGVLAKTGAPMLLVFARSCVLGALLGALNGALVAYLRLPSIVVTLATMIVLRDALRWITQGAWVQDLPPDFQWLGLSQGAVSRSPPGCCRGDRRGACVGSAIHGSRAAVLRHRIEPRRGAARGRQHVARQAVCVCVARRPDRPRRGAERDAVQPDSGQHRARPRAESHRRRRRRRHCHYRRPRHAAGTVLGVVLLGAIGPALTFLGVSAYWERAIQGAIILVAVAADALPRHQTPRMPPP